MADHRQRIPAEELPDEPRNWSLPFWTEPTHIVETPEDLGGQDDVLMETAEIETVEPLTAEELELIRQEAFNEGLQQGLIEGRQKGEKEGHKEGFDNGLAQGKKEGHEQGYQTGLEEGQIEANNRGEQQRDIITQQLQNFISALNSQLAEQQKDIEKVLPNIVEHLAKAVITEELSQGSDHIVHIVKQAIHALPVSLKDYTIELNHNDFPYIEAAIEQNQLQVNLESNESIDAGGCLIHTEKSLVDFQLSERWKNIIKQYHNQVQLGQISENQEDHLDGLVDAPDLAAAQQQEQTDKLEEQQADSNEQAEETHQETSNIIDEPSEPLAEQAKESEEKEKIENTEQEKQDALTAEASNGVEVENELDTSDEVEQETAELSDAKQSQSDEPVSDEASFNEASPNETDLTETSKDESNDATDISKTASSDHETAEAQVAQEQNAEAPVDQDQKSPNESKQSTQPESQNPPEQNTLDLGDEGEPE